MFHCAVFRGIVGCVALTATLFLGGCGGQQISSSAQDRSLEEGSDVEMAAAQGLTPENAQVGEETLPPGSETVPGSSAAVPETETVAESAVAVVPDTESTPESMVGSDPTTGTMEEPSSAATTDEPPMIAGLVPEEPSAATPESSTDATSAAAAAASAFGDVVLEDIYFDFDRFALRDGARAKLEANADQLKKLEGWHLVIEGHCDERGTEAYNLVLGERRASTVKQYLGELGVTVSDIKIISYGKERPFCADHNDECWKSNRRAHFIIK